MASEEATIEITDLYKTYHIGFFRKRVEAVRGISFHVKRGEIFGFIGPNGAGKTSTIKAILRLIFPTRGSIRLFGMPNSDCRARLRLGYLPENPYIYQYLKPLEFLELCGRLTEMAAEKRRQRSRLLIERLSLADAVDRPIGRFSKGMLQRLGLAQALLHEPELLILDEPFSGLDPIGRKDVRDVLLEHRNQGKTLLFTSHTLSDVEMLCDRVAIVKQGRLSALGALDDLLEPKERRVEVELSEVSPQLREQLASIGVNIQGHERELTLVLQGDEMLPSVIETAMKNGARVIGIRPHRDTLEDLFLRQAASG
ncbi:MAG: ABC transporter ATP-binding protein [Deltaproteobacteria bacterium]|nr:ABC transporter ATP-binding protein [Deltaproteobacteria bacterium]